MLYSIAAAFSLIGPVVVGALVNGINYLAVMGWSGACLLLACGCTVVARCKIKKWRRSIMGRFSRASHGTRLASLGAGKWVGYLGLRHRA